MTRQLFHNVNRTAWHRVITRRLSIAALCLAFTPIGVLAQSEPETPVDPAWTELDRRVGAGETCLVCGNRIEGQEIVELQHKGRTFHVKAGEMYDAFATDPDRYFAKLQARAALFDEGSIMGKGQAMEQNWGWLIFGSYVLLGLIFGALCGYIAVGKALSPLPWFFAGLAGNVAALVVVLAARPGDASVLPAGVPPGLRKVPLTRDAVSCSSCGALNHPAAASCSSCGSALSPTIQAETAHV